MNLKEVNIKSILALIIVTFGICAIVFVNIQDMALGALISFVSQVIGYFFGSSKGSEAKDKTIQDMNSKSVVSTTDEEPEIGGGGQKNPPTHP